MLALLRASHHQLMELSTVVLLSIDTGREMVPIILT